MSQPTPSFPDFGNLVPGFDFLQNLTKQATGSAAQSTPQLPNLANWIAPTSPAKPKKTSRPDSQSKQPSTMQLTPPSQPLAWPTRCSGGVR